MTGRVPSHVTMPGGTRKRTCHGIATGTPISTSRSDHGTKTPTNTPIQTIGNGIGSRRSYSL
ncbi:hypothetical protein HD595_004573 [Nonomuraea roseoviolacea subsp. carminata]|uniref:Uncharacterized protein n=1 Tax=Nonomuraea roseoviolacea subsp. carminata TaxID=160689 RepID=A0ABT1K380_9ACTN|nr:hypothetical protein [Nonomuraea roseoviolacea subsp. carminata]